MSSTSQTELENRLHALTESLIQKQTMLEALGTEKNSLVLQLERMEVKKGIIYHCILYESIGSANDSDLEPFTVF